MSSPHSQRGRPIASQSYEGDDDDHRERDESPGSSSYHDARETFRPTTLTRPMKLALPQGQYEHAHAHPHPHASTSKLPPDDGDLMIRCHPPEQQPSFVFVCLGVGGGPLENDCSCYMVKAADRDWRDGSILLEGGSWLGALSKLCEPDTPSPAFHDFDFTHTSPSIRAGEIGSHAKAFLITHAHLDHILGMVLGSASLPGKRSVYGLPSTLDNLLGIFDGKLWPKLASLDENAPHIVYHCKPIECQKPLHLDDDICVLPFALSHGLNMSTVPAPPTPAPQPPMSSNSYFSKRYSLPLNSLSAGTSPSAAALGFVRAETPGRTTFTSPFAPDRNAFYDSLERSYARAHTPTPTTPTTSSPSSSPRQGQLEFPSNDALSTTTTTLSAAPPPRKSSSAHLRAFRRPKTASGSEKARADAEGMDGGGGGGDDDAASSTTTTASSSTAAPRNGSASSKQHRTSSSHAASSSSTMDSTAFFLTNKQTGGEVLFFGDVEPDCVSRSPRNRRVWQHAASKFALDKLNAVFLECSFPAAQPTEFLWGHLSTCHLYDELKVLARCVKSERAVLARRKAAAAGGDAATPPLQRSVNFSKPLPVIPPSPLVPIHSGSGGAYADLKGVLRGLTVIIIHAKQAFFPSYASSSTVDTRTIQERILQELQEMEEENALGVRFVMSRQGMRVEV